MESYKLAKENKEYIFDLRRYFHKNPELSWEEVNTTKKIAEELDKLGISYNFLPKTGLIATIKEEERETNNWS